jgi:hypothetical protein
VIEGYIFVVATKKGPAPTLHFVFSDFEKDEEPTGITPIGSM